MNPDVQNKTVLVLGLGRSGVAAARLLAERGARVIGVDNAKNEALQTAATALRAQGVETRLRRRATGVGGRRPGGA